jgi:hypothetical protein
VSEDRPEAKAPGARAPQAARLSSWEVGAILVLFALVAVLLRGYSVVGYQTDPSAQIPLILRALDPSYLTNDWWVDQQSAWVARYAFIQLTAQLAKAMGIEVAYFLGHYVGALGVSVVTYLVATRALRASQLAGLIAASLAVAIELIDYGAVIQLVNPDLVPAALAEPVALLALGFALARRPVWCALAAGTASAMQPLLGIVPGGLALMTLAVTAFWDRQALWPLRIRVDYRQLGQALLGLAVLAPFALFWVVVSASNGASADYIRIIAEVRAPHHWLPSAWFLENHLWIAVLALGYMGLFAAWRRRFADQADPYVAQFVAVFSLAIVTLCLLSYVFVEIVPWRTMLTIQAFRYLHLIVWLFLIITGILAAEALHRGSPVRRLSRGVWLLAGNLSAYAPMIFVAGLLSLFDRNGRRPQAAWLQGLFAAVHTALIIMVLMALGDQRLLTVSLAGFVLAIWIAWVERRSLRGRVPIVAMAFFCGGVLANQAAPLPAIGGPLDRLAKVDLTFERVAARAAKEGGEFDQLIEVAQFARLALPADAVVLTPPAFGAFRVFGERAIVADFKSLPFDATDDWYQRMTDAYPPGREAVGWDLAAEMNRAYREADDDHIKAVASKYDARFAVLFNETATALPVLFTGSRYKLVALDENA